MGLPPRPPALASSRPERQNADSQHFSSTTAEGSLCPAEPARLPRRLGSASSLHPNRESPLFQTGAHPVQAGRPAQGAEPGPAPPAPLFGGRSTATAATPRLPVLRQTLDLLSCCRMSAEEAVPGAEFYYERLQRAQAIPESERSPDVAAWLASHASLEAAAAALPAMPAGATLTQPLGGKAALAALLQFLVHSHIAVPATLAHPHITFSRLWPQLPPLMAVSCQSLGGSYTASSQPLLGSLLLSGLASAAADLELLARLLLLASLSIEPGFEQTRLGCDILAALGPALSGEQVQALLSRQLLELEQQLESSGGSFKPDLPSVQQLQAAQHSISVQLFMQSQRDTLPQQALASLLQLAENATLQHLAQQPNSPRYSLERGVLAFDRGCASPQPGVGGVEAHVLCTAAACWTYLTALIPGCARSPLTNQLQACLSEAVPQFLRAAQLARRKGSDLLLARWVACSSAAAPGACEHTCTPSSRQLHQMHVPLPCQQGLLESCGSSRSGSLPRPEPV